MPCGYVEQVFAELSRSVLFFEALLYFYIPPVSLSDAYLPIHESRVVPSILLFRISLSLVLAFKFGQFPKTSSSELLYSSILFFLILFYNPTGLALFYI
jgi:hypothetical protein